MLVGNWRKRSHLRPFCRRRQCWFSIPTIYWLLLLSGDVEANPGPPTRGSSSKRQADQRILNCCSLNARSVVNKSLDLQAYLQCNSLDLLAVTETFLSSEILDGEVIDHGYTVHRRDRDRHGGGVLLIVHNSIPSTRRQDLETDCELLWVELSLTPTNLLVGVYYNPPGHNCGSLTHLRNSLAITPRSSPVVLVGDFNLPNIDWSSDSPTPTVSSANTTLMCDIVNDFNLQQLVHSPTRQLNILDLVLTDRVDCIDKVEVAAGLPGSDHDAVHFTTSLRKRKFSTQKRWSFNFKKADFEGFNELLSKVPWDCCFLSESVDDCWTHFKDILFSIADQCIPKIALHPRKSTHWLSEETLRLVRKNRRAYKLARRSNNPYHLRRYKTISNLVRNQTRMDHAEHLNQITLNLSQDQRPFWRWLNNTQGQRFQIPNIHHAGIVLSTPSEKASVFNQFFTSIFTSENTSNLSELRRDLQKSWCHDSVADITISRDDVYDLLSKLDVSKSCGPDEVPARLLREGACWLADPLTRLYNISLCQGRLPSDWTSANVTPVFKKGSKHLASNYRPISLTCTAVRLLERLLHDHIVQFLTHGSKLSPFQHGFRKGHSCQTQLLESVHEWARSLDKASSTHVIFTDFSKAFDSVPHQRLLLKLEQIGIRGNIHAWISSFLAHRRQRVLLDGCASDWSAVTSGVPQGSILGPLLFIIFVNDIPNCLSSPTRLFADDCTIYRQVSSHQDCVALQEDLTRLFRWCQTWQLPLNTKKCKVMCISLKKKPPSFTYSINNTTLDWVDVFRYLGVTINSKLKWGDHIAEVTAKASRILNLLRRTMRSCRRDAKSRAYTALVRPILEYSVPVWAPHEQQHNEALEACS